MVLKEHKDPKVKEDQEELQDLPAHPVLQEFVIVITNTLDTMKDTIKDMEIIKLITILSTTMVAIKTTLK
jgi:aspartate/glutamate racemase